MTPEELLALPDHHLVTLDEGSTLLPPGTYPARRIKALLTWPDRLRATVERNRSGKVERRAKNRAARAARRVSR